MKPITEYVHDLENCNRHDANGYEIELGDGIQHVRLGGRGLVRGFDEYAAIVNFGQGLTRFAYGDLEIIWKPLRKKAA